jgi:hypothetical protein
MIEALAHHTKQEHFDTPEYAVKPLIFQMRYAGYTPGNCTAWECTDTYGRSGITTALRKDGYSVEATNFDFLNCVVEGHWDMIVTNPPFNKKDQFIKRCIDYSKPFALLLPLTALEGIRRHHYWKSIEADFGLLVLDKRVEFTGEGVWFNTSWFCYKIFKGIRFAKL